MKKDKKKTTNSTIPKTEGTLRENLLLKRNLPSVEINFEMETKPEITEP